MLYEANHTYLQTYEAGTHVLVWLAHGACGQIARNTHAHKQVIHVSMSHVMNVVYSICIQFEAL